MNTRNFKVDKRVGRTFPNQKPYPYEPANVILPRRPGP